MSAINESLLGPEGGDTEAAATANQFMQDGVCDFVSKNNYREYNRVLATVPDDASQLEQHLRDMKAAFRSGTTRE